MRTRARGAAHLRLLVIASAVAGSLAAPAALATNGYFQHGFGVKADGMGGVGIALPQDSIAAASNPAGMAFVGKRFDGGLTWFKPTRGAAISGSPAPINGDYDGNDKNNFFIPELGFNTMVSPTLALGLSVYGNGGMNTAYTTPVPLFGTSNAGVDLSQLFISPTVAWKLAPEHAIGLSLNLAYQRFKATGLENFTAPSGPMRFSQAPDKVTNQGYDDSTGFGVRIGYYGQFTPAFAVGLVYQSKTSMQAFGKYAGLFAEQGGFDIPASYGLGLAFKPAAGWTVAFDILRIEYSDVPSVANPLLPNLFNAPLGSDNGAGFGWKDVTAYKLGVDYVLDPQWTLRAGYNYGKQPIPPSETLFNILAPGVVEQHFTLGATWTMAPNNELSAAFTVAPEKKVAGPNAIPAAFGGGNVELRLREVSFGVTYGLKF